MSQESTHFSMKLRRADRVYAAPFEAKGLENTGSALLVCLPVLLLLLTTLPQIATGYWEDEIFSINISRSWSGLFFVFHEYENNMALYDVVLHTWMRLFGESEVATHALSLFFAVLTIPVFFAVARHWLNKSSALLATLLLSVNPLFVYYAVETRSYSLLVFSVLVSTGLFIRLLQKPGYPLAVCYGLSVAAGVYLHYFGFLLVAVHGLAVFSREYFNRRYLPRFGVAVLTVLAGIAPLFLFPPKNKTQVDWILKPDGKNLWYAFSGLFGGGFAIVLLVVCLLFVLRKRIWKKVAPDGYLLPKLALAWALFPVCLLFVFSHLVKPLFLTRFFVWCVPGTVLVATLLIGYTGWGHFRKAIAWGLLLAITLTSAYRIFPNKGSGYKSTVAYLNSHVRPGEAVIAYPFYKTGHTDFYLDKIAPGKTFERPLPITRLPYLPGGGGKDPDPDLGLLRNIAARKGRIYLICKADTGRTRTDTVQNRTWLPEIQGILAGKHAAQHEVVFGARTQEPVRIVIYE